MAQERESTESAASPKIEIQGIDVADNGRGGRTLTARIGQSLGGFHPIQATQDLLHNLYSGLPHTQPDKADGDKKSGDGEKKGGDGAASEGSTWGPMGASTASQGPKPSESGWATKEYGGARADRTDEYRQLADAAKAGKNTLPPDAKQYIYLMVPGLFTEHYPGYMKDNIARMQALGLDTRVVKIDTDASVETNAKVIKDTIDAIAKQEGKEVVLIGHSKGGVDATAALAMYPELYEHVRAVIAMQTPYGGTPIASDIMSNSKLLGLVGGAIRRLFKGDEKALTDLSYQARQEFVHQHNYDAGKVATVSFGTTGGPKVSTVGPTQSYMKNQYGLESDGLVPKNDAVVPGSDLVTQDNQDHASPVMGVIGRGKADVPADITQALITLALRRAAEMDKEEGAGRAPGPGGN